MTVMAFSDEDIAAEFGRETKTDVGQLTSHTLRNVAARMIPPTSATGKTRLRKNLREKSDKKAERNYYVGAIDNRSVAE